MDNQLFIEKIQEFIEDCRYLKHLGFEERMELVMDIDFISRECFKEIRNNTKNDTLDAVQDHLQQQSWYIELSLPDKLEVLESFCDLCDGTLSVQKGKRWTAEGRLLIEKEKSRKLYHACLHAFQWHVGNGTEEAEKECMRVLEEAVELYNKKEN